MAFIRSDTGKTYRNKARWLNTLSQNNGKNGLYFVKTEAYRENEADIARRGSQSFESVRM